ncbi:MAG TPA: hypothetical protein GXX36_09420 [Clostridiaceae bacterium]|nr:hypothetical protein [Clostridiaceae bacterium]
MVFSKGGIRVTPQELGQEIMNTCKNMKNAAVNKPIADNAIMAGICQDGSLARNLGKYDGVSFDLT